MSYHLLAKFVAKDLDIRTAYLATSETGKFICGFKDAVGLRGANKSKLKECTLRFESEELLEEHIKKHQTQAERRKESKANLTCETQRLKSSVTSVCGVYHQFVNNGRALELGQALSPNATKVVVEVLDILLSQHPSVKRFCS